jgi:hypothetical protein
MPSDETALRRESPERNAVAHGVVWFGVVLACSVVLGWVRVESALVVAGLSAVVYASIVYVREPY